MFEDRINFGVILRPQHFYNKFYTKNCYWWVKKIILVFGQNQNQ